MISGQRFQRKRSKKWIKLHKITHNSIKNRGSTLILNKSGTDPPKKHPQQIFYKSLHRFKR